jgi:hypothetical protein
MFLYNAAVIKELPQSLDTLTLGARGTAFGEAPALTGMLEHPFMICLTV